MLFNRLAAGCLLSFPGRSERRIERQSQSETEKVEWRGAINIDSMNAESGAPDAS